MTTDSLTLKQVSELVKSELPGYLTDEFVIDDVTSEFMEDMEGERYVRTMVIFQDGHPRPNPRALNRFQSDLKPRCDAEELYWPTVVYANRSEIPV